MGRRVVADALRGVDPAGARSAEQETNWRAGYLVHFRRLLEAGLESREAAVRIATDGLASLRDTMVVRSGDTDVPLEDWAGSTTHGSFGTAVVTGEAEAETALSLPFRGERLRGDALRRRVGTWVAEGVVEPSVADRDRGGDRPS